MADLVAILALLLCCLTFLIGLAAVLVWYDRWEQFGWLYHEILPKGAIAGVRFASALVLFLPRFFEGVDKNKHWQLAAVAAFLSWLVWELAALTGEERRKAEDEAEEVTAEEYRQQSLFRTRLLTTLRRLVNAKARRIQKAVSPKPQEKATIGRTRDALDAPLQTTELLSELAFFLQYRARKDGDSERGSHLNFRVGFYVADIAGTLKPIESYDSKTGMPHPFTSYQESVGHFKLMERERPSETVRCIQEKRMRIVPDCEKAANLGAFFYFNDAQKGYLGSMVSFPIPEFFDRSGRIAQAALVVDTDMVGFFDERDRASLEFALHEFSARLRLEALLACLTKDQN